MTKRDLWTVAVSGVFGLIGGILSTSIRLAGQATPEVLKASRFELVDESGRQIGIWGLQDTGGAELNFSSKEGRVLASFGIREAHSPFLTMYGQDGKIRVTIQLGNRDKPVIGMGDEDWEGHVLLGSLEHDVRSEQAAEDWGLLFRGPGTVHDIAGIGMTSKPKGISVGRLSIRSSTGKRWSVPD
ncbi:MAG: hypothetical protein HY235_26830 [Acidobacteria bacterium]|nr:hypothetical protein [Acidobacteriota bacterium]